MVSGVSPLSKQTENEFDGDAHAPNDGFVTNTLGVHRYASKKCLVDHGFRFTFDRTFFRWDIVTAGASALRRDSDQD
jgi:hypothetical protein